MGTLRSAIMLYNIQQSKTIRSTLPYHKDTTLIQKSPSYKTSSVMAKYGDESIYFDLDDMENTVGSWEMYGEDGKKRYPALQEDFVNLVGQALNRRGAMLAFCAMSGTASVLIWGAKGSRDAKLPITLGPQTTPRP